MQFSNNSLDYSENVRCIFAIERWEETALLFFLSVGLSRWQKK
jgi:hypothetical protein